MVERKTLNLVVVGSIPTGGVLVFFFPHSHFRLHHISLKTRGRSKWPRTVLNLWGRPEKNKKNIPTKFGTLSKNIVLTVKKKICTSGWVRIPKISFSALIKSFFKTVPSFLGMFSLFLSSLSHEFKTLWGYLDLSWVLSEMWWGVKMVALSKNTILTVKTSIFSTQMVGW